VGHQRLRGGGADAMSRYTVMIDASAPLWARRLAEDLNAALNRIRLDLRPKRFEKADLPLDDSERVAIVTDEVGGVTLAFYDGAQWRRVQDRVLVS
jgi:hypothetical protein